MREEATNESISNKNEEEKKPKSTVIYDVFYNKRELKKLANERLEKVYNDNTNALKICIDCSFSSKMSNKGKSTII